VYCWVFIGGWPLGVGAPAGPDWDRDDTHLWHLHLSIIRKFCGDWEALSGVLSVMRGETLDEWRDKDMPLTPEDKTGVTEAVWAKRYKEFVDTDGDGTRAELAAVRAGQAAVLAAVEGLDTDAVLARIDKVAADEIARDQAAAQRDADLRTLVEQGQSGQLSAEDVVRRMGELLTAAPDS
jgi:hypothetical protein